ncbi:MAG: DUF2188 domain-containing protein [Actinomycetota bacterium]|nr:DUF2188 domain-containing protein [Actinomycetota bacterium]MDP9020506.1 DUF2188 domain-containing protein [Actinomycetota bacterium]
MGTESVILVGRHGGNWVVRRSLDEPPVATFTTREEAEQRASELAAAEGLHVEVGEEPSWDPEQASRGPGARGPQVEIDPE